VDYEDTVLSKLKRGADVKRSRHDIQAQKLLYHPGGARPRVKTSARSHRENFTE
jgi:hypothetical protein